MDKLSMETGDMVVVAKAVAGTIREQIKKALFPVTARLDQIERVQPVIGKHGADGKQGERGEPGPAGKDASPLVVSEVAAALAKLIPVPENGRDGRDGKSVTAEDFRQMFEAEHAKWTLDFERRSNETVRRFLDKLPKPADGKDGLGFDDLTVEHDGERGVTLRFTRGEQIKEFSFELPAMIYRAIWKDGAYKAGDVVTWAGSAFVAKRDTESKPETDDSWQLMAKRGRDGKDGEKGAKGDVGKSGDNGRDLTQMSQDGRKF